jgi:hypothetical protein
MVFCWAFNVCLTIDDEPMTKHQTSQMPTAYCLPPNNSWRIDWFVDNGCLCHRSISSAVYHIHRLPSYTIFNSEEVDWRRQCQFTTNQRSTVISKSISCRLSIINYQLSICALLLKLIQRAILRHTRKIKVVDRSLILTSFLYATNATVAFSALYYLNTA